MDYKSSLDTLCKIITAGVFILFLTIGQKNVRAIIAAHGDLAPTLIHGTVFLFLMSTLVFTYLYRTTHYSVSTSELIIHRPIKDRIIQITDISEIRQVDSSDFSGILRTFGNGGLFGYYGKYYSTKLGSMTWYVTQRKNRILIQTQQGKNIVISPDDIGLLDKVQLLKQGKQL